MTQRPQPPQPTLRSERAVSSLPTVVEDTGGALLKHLCKEPALATHRPRPVQRRPSGQDAELHACLSAT